MNKYLEKIASDSEHREHHFGKGLVIGLGSHAAGSATSSLIEKSLVKEMYSDSKIPDHIVRHAVKSNPKMNVTFSSSDAFGGNERAGQALEGALARSGPAYVPPHYANKFQAAYQKASTNSKIPSFLKSHIAETAQALKTPMTKNYLHSAGANNTILMHELGHAKDFAGKSLSTSVKLKTDHISRKLHQYGVGSVVGSAALGHEKTRKYAWAAPLVASLPMLRSEAAANHHGYKMLADKGSSEMKKQFLRSTGKNLSHYGAIPIMTSLGLYAGGKLLDHLDKTHDD